MNQEINIEAIMQLIELKKTDPDGYKQFLVGFEEISGDLLDVVMRLSNKYANDLLEKWG